MTRLPVRWLAAIAAATTIVKNCVWFFLHWDTK